MCELAARFADVGGWLHPAEGIALTLLAAAGDGYGRIVEVGSFRGLSTCWLATGSQTSLRGDRELIYAVDHFQGSVDMAKGGKYEDPGLVRDGTTFPVFEENLRRLGLWGLVRPVVSDSLSAARTWENGPIRLLFIDADHEYEAVKADFWAWRGHVCEGGCIAFHDYGVFDGVTKFYDQLKGGVFGYKEVLAVQSLRVVQRLPSS